jgi:peptidoglycan-associated lipoprotein
MGTIRTRVQRGVSGLMLALAFGACATKAPAPPVTANNLVETQRAAPPAKVASAGAEQPSSCELESIYFGFDSSDLDLKAKEVLARDQKCAQQKGATSLRVVGMTDPRGTEEYNLALGDQRAKNAARYLSTLGVTEADAKSLGSEMAKGHDEESWAHDRRTEVQLK